MGYEIGLDARHRVRRARICARSGRGATALRLDGDGARGRRVDGRRAPGVDGCLDVDLESSALTDAFPVWRLGLAPEEEAEAPAVYVSAHDLAVQRLEQRYAAGLPAREVRPTTTRARPSRPTAPSSTTPPDW